MDFVSLDILPKESQFEATVVETSTTSNHLPFYKSIGFKSAAIVLFISVLCFPQPEWLITMLSHPVGALALASFVALALLPELEWWVVLIAVGVTYLVFSITGMIESNLERKKVEEETKKAKQQKKEEDEEEQEHGNGNVGADRMMMMEPVAANF